MSIAQRRELVANANAAMRKPDPTVRLALKSQSGQSRWNGLTGPGEHELHERLLKNGHEVITQKSIHVYNVDVVFGTVAVEVKFGAHGRFTSNISAHRFEKIIEAGLKPVVLIIRDVYSLRHGLEEMVALLETVHRKPSTSCQYWVIRCGLQDSTIRKNNLSKCSLEAPPPELVTSIREVCFR